MSTPTNSEDRAPRLLDAHGPLRFGVVGAPAVVANSLSPRMMTAAFAELGIDATYEPLAIEDTPLIAAQDLHLPSAIRAVGTSGYFGCNVTMPFKTVAASIATHPTERVIRAGAANTLRFDPDGSIHADATDGIALIDALDARGREGDLAGASIALLGAGGAATEAAIACIEAGAAHLHIWNRTPERAHELAARLRNIAPAMSLQVHIDLPIREPVHFVVGCVPAYALDVATCTEWEGDPSFIDYAYVRSGAATPLMVAADSRGADCIDGRELLVRQGAAALRVWLPDVRPPIEVMLRAAR